MKTIVTMLSTVLAVSASTSALAGKKPPTPPPGGGGEKTVTIIHMGDLHGHTVPRPNLRSDGDGRMEGGLARMYKEIQSIRSDATNTLLINTGDTIQGSGEALYSRGQALVDVVDLFGIDAFAPGNWEYVYGPDRFKELFGDGTGRYGKGNRWGALAGNLYNTASKNADGRIIDADGNLVTSPAFPNGIPASLPRVHTAEEYSDWHEWYANNGDRILPPYAIKQVNDVKVGIVGCTTRRGPQVVGRWVVEGIEFTDCAKEVPKYVAEVRRQGVDLVVLITEIEVGANIEMVSTFDALDGDNHIDLIVNSDMHEETVRPIEVPNKSRTAKTLIIEEGQDGTMIGEIEFKIRDRKVVDWDFEPHRIHDGIKEDKTIARKVAQVRAPYTTRFAEYAADPIKREAYHKSPFANTYLNGSLDEVVGRTEKGLHRSGYTDEALYSRDPDAMPAVIEGTSHDWIADAIRWWAKSDLATVRGFRYGTHVKPGPITRNDLYHFVPIGARVGKSGKIHANQLRNQVDNSSLSVFSISPMDTATKDSPYNNEGWAGGWMFAYSGPTLSLDPYWVRRGATAGVYPGDSRARGIKVLLTCDRLPPLEQDPNQVCEQDPVTGAWSYSRESMINDARSSEEAVAAGARPGDWTPAWAANAPAGSQAAYRDLEIDESTGAWSSKPAPASHTRVNHMPVMDVAGYYYARSPYTLNNCPNCNPRGYADVTPGTDLGPDAPYLLPVNMNPETGRAWLDDNGRPALATDAAGHTVWEDGHPVPLGEEIDLTMVLEKYLQSPGAEPAATPQDRQYDMDRGRGPANPAAHRITLQKPLPGRETFGGLAVMQPLCGVVASYFSKPDPDTTWGLPGTPEYDTRIMATPVPECPHQ